MTEYMGWGQTTSSDNFKQYLVVEKTTLDGGTVLNAGDILVLIPPIDGYVTKDIYYKRDDASQGIRDPDGFEIPDVNILKELDTKTPLFSKEIDDTEYRFTKRDFIYIFKPKIPDELSPEDRKKFMEILELILKSYSQNTEIGSFQLKSESDREILLTGLDETKIAGYRDIIETLGGKLDYIRMAIKLGEISTAMYEGFKTGQGQPTAQMKYKRKLKKSKKRKKKSSKKKKNKSSKKKKKNKY